MFQHLFRSNFRCGSTSSVSGYAIEKYWKHISTQTLIKKYILIKDS